MTELSVDEILAIQLIEHYIKEQNDDREAVKKYHKFPNNIKYKNKLANGNTVEIDNIISYIKYSLPEYILICISDEKNPSTYAPIFRDFIEYVYIPAYKNLYVEKYNIAYNNMRYLIKKVSNMYFDEKDKYDKYNFDQDNIINVIFHICPNLKNNTYSKNPPLVDNLQYSKEPTPKLLKSNLHRSYTPLSIKYAKQTPFSQQSISSNTNSDMDIEQVDMYYTNLPPDKTRKIY